MKREHIVTALASFSIGYLAFDAYWRWFSDSADPFGQNPSQFFTLACGFASGCLATWAFLMLSVETRLRRLRLEMEKELEELKQCVARAKAGPDRWKITTPDGKE